MPRVQADVVSKWHIGKIVSNHGNWVKSIFKTIYFLQGYVSIFFCNDQNLNTLYFGVLFHILS